MIKKGLLMFGVLIFATAFAVPGVASATTYQGFTSSLHEAYEGSD
jgi:hypothetical protein